MPDKSCKEKRGLYRSNHFIPFQHKVDLKPAIIKFGILMITVEI